MENLFTLPVDIQIMLVSGFVGFYINTVGKTTKDNLIKLFQILVFGTLGAIVFTALKTFIDFDIGKEGNLYILVNFFVTFASSVFLALVWRKKGQNWFVTLMMKLGVYHDVFLLENIIIQYHNLIQKLNQNHHMP